MPLSVSHARLRMFLPLLLLASSCIGAQTVDRPLPDLHSVLARADAVAKSSLQKAPDYEFVQVESQSVWNAERETATEIVSLIYSVQGVGVSRELLKDRSPLTLEMQQKVDRDVAKTVRAGLKRKPEKDDTSFDWNMSDLVKIATLSNMQRIRWKGRDVLRVHMEGDPKAHTNGLMQKFEAHVSGTLVFDEEDGALQDVDVVLNSDCSFMMIAKGRKGMQLKASYIRLAPNDWQQQSIEIDGRFTYLFHDVAGHLEVRQYGYHVVPRRLTDPYHGISYAALSPLLKQEIDFCLEAFDSDVNEESPGQP